jgi:hypothetical protein
MICVRDGATAGAEEHSHRPLKLDSASLAILRKEMSAARRVWGGTDGNEQLTAIAGAVLIVLLAILGVTIVRIGQLTWLHLFVGLLLIGPVMLKMLSTGYRFARYYLGARSYRAKGPPPPLLRLIAPVVVVTTVVVFATGVVLLFQGPAHRGPAMLLHKASFIIWLGATGLHVLGHLPGLGRTLNAGRGGPGAASGTGVRWLLLSTALVGGLVLAVVLIPDFAAWTAAGALHEH